MANTLELLVCAILGFFLLFFAVCTEWQAGEESSSRSLTGWLTGWLQAFVFTEVFMVQIPSFSSSRCWFMSTDETCYQCWLFLHWNLASASLTYLLWNCSRVCPTVMQEMGTLGYTANLTVWKLWLVLPVWWTKGKQQSSTVLVEVLGSIIMGGHERTHHCCLQIGGALWQIAKGFTIVSWSYNCHPFISSLLSHCTWEKNWAFPQSTQWQSEFLNCRIILFGGSKQASHCLPWGLRMDGCSKRKEVPGTKRECVHRSIPEWYV